MTKKYYTDEKNAQVVLALLKAHGIRKVIASPGTTNMALVGSMQHDAYFEMYSSVDERSAAYMACGLAAESGEPVVISCTGATASRNYLSGLTEAFYRKLPILAITSTQAISRNGHHVAQTIDRSSKPKDTAKLSVTLPIVKDNEDLWECETKVNQAILELQRNGGGPVHINLTTDSLRTFTTEDLPKCRIIRRVTQTDNFPELPKGRIAIFVGAHAPWSSDEVLALESFCRSHNAAVFCDHTSNYKGEFRLLYSLVAGQRMFSTAQCKPDLVIHIGEVSGDYYGARICNSPLWRISEDGEVRDTFRQLQYVFAMSEKKFFEHYVTVGDCNETSFVLDCKTQQAALREEIPELPFSNVWLASKMAHRLPDHSTIHFGILNSLRSWNFFEIPKSVHSASNVGGFGIDGGVSALIGASLANREKLYFGIVGDLAFFYDMNVMGNRHVGRNLRIMIVNNGKGTEFRQYGHHAAHLGDDADAFIAAAGHFGRKSSALIKHYAEDLGFEYLVASDKDSFHKVSEKFLVPHVTDRSIVMEVFTDSVDESRALEAILNIDTDTKARVKKFAKNMLGEGTLNIIKGLVRS